MLLRIMLLFSVIIIALIFKYYIFKYQYFKKKILEGNADQNSAITSVSNIPTIDLIRDIGNQIVDLNNKISQEWDKLKLNTLTEKQQEESMLERTRLLQRLKSEYNSLDNAFTLLLGERTTDINNQKANLNAANIEQNNINAQIQAMADAENKTITITQDAKNHAKTAVNALDSSIVAIQNGDIPGANAAYTTTKTAYNSIINSESDMRNNVNIASSKTANTMLTMFNNYKNNTKMYMDTTQNSPSVATSVNTIITANVEAKNAYAVLTDLVSKAITATDTNTSRDYINKAKDSYNAIKASYEKSKQNLPNANNIPDISNLPKIENMRGMTIIENAMPINATETNDNTRAIAIMSGDSLTQAETNVTKIEQALKAKADADEIATKAAAAATTAVATLYYKFGSNTTVNSNQVACYNEQNQKHDLTINVPFTNAVKVNKSSYIKYMGTTASLQCTGNNWAIIHFNYPNLIYSTYGISFMGWYYSNHTQQQSFNGCDVRIIGLKSKSIKIYLTIDANAGFGLNLFVSSYINNKWNAQNKYVYNNFVNEWAHVAITYTGTTLTFYHNGNKIVELAVAATSVNDKFEMTSVGDFEKLQTHLYTGDILRFNEFYFYNRIMNITEIQKYYSDTKNLVINIQTKPSKFQFDNTPKSQNDTIQVPRIDNSNFIFYSNRLFNSNISFSIVMDDDFIFPYTTYWYNSSNYNGSVQFYYNNTHLKTINNVNTCQNTNNVNQIVISSGTSAGCVINYINMAKLSYE